MSQPEHIDEGEDARTEQRDGPDGDEPPNKNERDEAEGVNEGENGADPGTGGSDGGGEDPSDDPQAEGGDADGNNGDTDTENTVETPDSGTEFVSVDAVAEQLERRIGDTGYKSKIANIIEELPDQYVKRERRDDGHVIKLKPEGLSEVRKQNTGSAGSGGSHTHRYVLRKAHEALTTAGFMVDLPEQEGANQPDGVAELPVDISSDSYPEMRAKMAELNERWPDAHRISNGTNLYIEAETSTTSKPQQTLSNLEKAHREGRRCVFAFQDCYEPDGNKDMAERARDAVRILTDPPGVASQDPQSRRFYNKSDRLEVDDDIYAIRARTETGSTNKNTYWWERSDGTVALTDSNSPGGTPFAQFADLKSVIDPDSGDVPAYYEYDHSKKEYIVTDNQGEGTANRTIYEDKERFKEEWAKIYPPFIPEAEFGGRLPSPEDWICVIFPNDNRDLPPLEYVYNGHHDDGNIDGTLRPLLAKDRVGFDPSGLEPFIKYPREIPSEPTPSSPTTTGGEADTEDIDGNSGSSDTDVDDEVAHEEDTETISGTGTETDVDTETEGSVGETVDPEAATAEAETESAEVKSDTGAEEGPGSAGGSADETESEISGPTVNTEITSEPRFDFDEEKMKQIGKDHTDDGTGAEASGEGEGTNTDGDVSDTDEAATKSDTTTDTETDPDPDTGADTEGNTYPATGAEEDTGSVTEDDGAEREADGTDDGIDRGIGETKSTIKSQGWYLCNSFMGTHLLSPSNTDLNNTLPKNQDERQNVALCGEQLSSVAREIDNPFDHTDEICPECERLLKKMVSGSSKMAEALEDYRAMADDDEGDFGSLL